MTFDVGYDPARIRRLSRSTIEAIEALATIRSDEPAADDAVRVARNARRTLEDTWLPLLRQIESSDAMISWFRASLVEVQEGWSATLGWFGGTGRGGASDEELLTEIAQLDEEVPIIGHGPEDAVDRWLDGRRDLAGELARRVVADPDFADRLVDAAYASPVVGMLTGVAEFPATFRADLAAATLAHPWWEWGWEMDKYSAAAETLLGSLVDDPARCLDVIRQDDVAATLAGWPPLDQDLVAEFVVAALRGAPTNDERLLPAGYAALQEFQRLANERPFDGNGFQPGVATGLARSIGAYVPTLSPGLENELAPVEVKSHGADGEFDLTLGSREELVDLFGAMARTPAAQVELGVTLDAAIQDALGSEPQMSIGAVAELAELIELAARNEDEELTIAAATRRASLLEVGGVIGLTVAVGTAIAGVHAAYRTITSYTIGSINDAIAGTVRADTISGQRLRPIAFQSIQIEACRRFAADSGVRRSHGAAQVDAEVLRSIDARLTGIDELMADPDADPGVRQRAILNLVDAVRLAGGGQYLDTILEENSVDDLNEAAHVTDL